MRGPLMLVAVALVAVAAIAIFYVSTMPKPAVASNNLHILINNGDKYALGGTVTLSLDAPDAVLCRYSNDGERWTLWEGFASTKKWALAPGSGLKTVYYECNDAKGEYVGRTTDDIIVDDEAPVVSVSSPADGDSYDTNYVGVAFVATDNFARKMNCSITLDNRNVASGPVTSGQMKSITLTSRVGEHSMRIACADETGNAGESERISYSITRETPTPRPTVTPTPTIVPTVAPSASPSATPTIYPTTPTALSVTINDGAPYTYSRNVVLRMSATNAETCRYSDDGAFFTSWEAYSTYRNWVLPPGTGQKRVYYQCRNVYGYSATVSDDIMLQETPPTTPPGGLMVRINDGATYATSTSVSLSLNAVGAAEARYSNSGLTYTDWAPYTAYIPNWGLDSTDGTKTVYYQCRNAAGNSDVATDTIILDKTPPAKPTGFTAVFMKKASLAGDTASEGDTTPTPTDTPTPTPAAPRFAVYLKWDAVSDATSGLAYYKVYKRVGAGTPAVVTTTTALEWTETIESPNPTASYAVSAVDNAGNEGLKTDFLVPAPPSK
ncbi:Uncharacterised protein [Candidatus Norongarragalina meridionalis]|nr:Uncharacterised protein [Candidatus Norongarragalina meridionalis]